MTIDLIPYLLVFCRMAGMILFNPLLARKNVPSQVKIGLVVGLMLLVTPMVQGAVPPGLTSLGLIFTMAKELFAGVACGFVFQIFYYMLFFAGDLMDMEFGLAMAKVFDPGTNIQMSLSANLLQLFFVLYLFATDSHLVMIRMYVSSYEAVPMGEIQIGAGIASFLVQLFISAASLAVRLVLPYMVAEFTLEVVMGVLMKLIPQINVFVINLQFEILFGFLLLFLFSGPMAAFVDNYANIMLQSMQEAIYALG